MEIDFVIDEKEQLNIKNDLFDWFFKSKCIPPAPNFVKWGVILRHALKKATWIETGTYLGNTALLLSRISNHVHTIEPSEECIKMARKKLSNVKNITLHEGTSEEVLEKVISMVNDNVCFWLDGHYSTGIEVTYKGDYDSPIKHELSTIERYRNKLGNLVVLIDDIRFSSLDKENYPPLDFFVQWAERNKLNWTIEQDIFVAKSTNLDLYKS